MGELLRAKRFPGLKVDVLCVWVTHIGREVSAAFLRRPPSRGRCRFGGKCNSEDGYLLNYPESDVPYFPSAPQQLPITRFGQ